MTVEEIRNYLFIIASEFKTTDTQQLSDIDTLITYSMSKHNEKILKVKYKEAIAYDVASQLSISGFKSVDNSNTSANQEILKKKAGNIEISYSNSSVSKSVKVTSADDLNDYGMKYKSIMKSIFVVQRFV